MNDYAYIFIITVVLASAFFIGWFNGHYLTITDFEHEAIKHGCAQYDTQTGQWGWKK